MTQATDQDGSTGHSPDEVGSTSSDVAPPGVEGVSPSRIIDPELRFEAKRAFVWAAVIGSLVLAIYIAQPLLVVFGAMVFAAMVDGGARLIGRVLPIARGFRVALVLAGIVLFFWWLVNFAGSQISREASQLPAILRLQAAELFDWLGRQGIEISVAQAQNLIGTLTSGVGTVTAAIGGLLGGLTTFILIVIIGLYVAAEPKLYERGVAWMLPRHQRSGFAVTVQRMAYTLRRLMAGRLVGMVFEGVLTWFMLSAYGWVTGDQIPMVALLAILTGLLAFIPNLGAIVSGVLMVLVGFSGGTQMGLYTVFVYFAVQNFDGYVIIPMIARKTVDLAPALVLAAQLVMGLLFGILGLFLADPLLAMIKVALERRAESNEAAVRKQGNAPSHPHQREQLKTSPD